MEAQRLLDIVGVALDLIDGAGINLADLDAAIDGIDKEADKLLAVDT